MWGCLVFVWIVVPSIVWATHETNHRFTVYGYVRDAQGQTAQDIKVMVVDNRIGEGSTAFTDRNGYYEVLLHLHDANQGDDITLTTPNETKTISANFNPEDHTTERKVQVDFGGPSTAMPTGLPVIWMYGAGAVLLIAGLLYWRVYSRKKQMKAQSQGWKKGKKK